MANTRKIQHGTQKIQYGARKMKYGARKNNLILAIILTWNIRSSQNFHNFISTHLLTVLIIRVITQLEQRKRNKQEAESISGILFLGQEA